MAFSPKSRIPLWGHLVVWAICILGLALSLPNLFHGAVERHNFARATLLATGGMPSAERQAALEAWPSWAPNRILELGLDLRGGSQLLAEVDLVEPQALAMEALWPEVRERLLALDAPAIGSLRRLPSVPETLRIAIQNRAAIPGAVQAIAALSAQIDAAALLADPSVLDPSAAPFSLAPNPIKLGGKWSGRAALEVSIEGRELVISFSQPARSAASAAVLTRIEQVLRARAVELGARLPMMSRESEERLLITLPGLRSSETMKAVIGARGQLSLNHLLQETQNAGADVAAHHLLVTGMHDPDAVDLGPYYIVQERPILTSALVASVDLQAPPAVTAEADVTPVQAAPRLLLQLSPEGAERLRSYHRTTAGGRFVLMVDGVVLAVVELPETDGETLSQADVLPIELALTQAEAEGLVALLDAGALPADLTFLEERSVTPELGRDAATAVAWVTLIAAVGMVVFMLGVYRGFGVVALLAFGLNLGLTLGALTALGAVLTLPGLAGLLLSLGICVDLHILLFERIREEGGARLGWPHGWRFKRGFAPEPQTGSQESLSSIVSRSFTLTRGGMFDANATVLIVGALLWVFGAEPVRGFGMSLMIGVIAALFTIWAVTPLLLDYALRLNAWRQARRGAAQTVPEGDA